MRRFAFALLAVFLLVPAIKAQLPERVLFQPATFGFGGNFHDTTPYNNQVILKPAHVRDQYLNPSYSPDGTPVISGRFGHIRPMPNSYWVRTLPPNYAQAQGKRFNRGLAHGRGVVGMQPAFGQVEYGHVIQEKDHVVGGVIRDAADPAVCAPAQGATKTTKPPYPAQHTVREATSNPKQPTSTTPRPAVAPQPQPQPTPATVPDPTPVVIPEPTPVIVPDPEPVFPDPIPEPNPFGDLDPMPEPEPEPTPGPDNPFDFEPTVPAIDPEPQVPEPVDNGNPFGGLDPNPFGGEDFEPVVVPPGGDEDEEEEYVIPAFDFDTPEPDPQPEEKKDDFFNPFE